ncbi:hypothetical protein MTR67_030979 [Solanum verrucosum]|uniref:Tf2-1-like SH3-like domain-containing protein n=1 Tax=Solanum verrucosum TaxID=315347 RepID=A0AAF0ZGW7_SOLVR|nr:hypothetical protein MTR67_030979 [Solanum verrucosum]
MIGVMRFCKKGKLSPRYVGSYRILKRIGKVAYELELPARLCSIEILDRHVRRLRNKEVASVKVLWRSQPVEGATWEAETAMKSKGGTHGHHSRTVDGLTVRPAGPWFVTESFPLTKSEKLAKSRLTDRPTIRRSDHGPWSMSVDRDFPYPASDTNYGPPAQTVNRSTVRRFDRR